MFKQRSISTLFFMALTGLATSSSSAVFAHEGSIHANDTAIAQTALNAEDKLVVKALEDYAGALQSKDMVEIEQYVLTGDTFSSIEGDAFLDQGWENYSKHLADKSKTLHDYRFTLSNIKPFVHGDLAYATMDYKMTFTIKSDQFKTGEGRFSMNGKATMVLWKTGNEWKVRHRHVTREQPASKKKSRK